MTRGRAALTALLAFGMAAGTGSAFFVGALAPAIIGDMALSRTTFGLLTTAILVVAAVAAPISGSLVDRLGGRPLLAATFALTSLSIGGMAVAPSYGWLLLAAALAGLPTAIANPATNQLVSRHVPHGRQGVVIGMKQSGVQVATLFSGLVLPATAAVVGWRGGLVLCTLLALVGLPATVTLIPGGHSTAAASASVHPVASLPIVVRLTAYAFLMGVATSAISAYLALYGVEAIGLTATASGLVLALLGLAGIVSRIVWARLAERSGQAWPLLGGMAVLGLASTVLLWGAEHYGAWLLWVGTLAFGTTALGWNAVANLVLVRELPVEVAGRASGTFQVGFYAGFATGPIGFGLTVDLTGAYGSGWLMIMVALGAAAAVLVTWAWIERRRYRFSRT